MPSTRSAPGPGSDRGRLTSGGAVRRTGTAGQGQACSLGIRGRARVWPLDATDIAEQRKAQGALVRAGGHREQLSDVLPDVHGRWWRDRTQDLGARGRFHQLSVVEELLVELLARSEADRLNRLTLGIAPREPDQVPGEV